MSSPLTPCPRRHSQQNLCLQPKNLHSPPPPPSILRPLVSLHNLLLMFLSLFLLLSSLLNLPQNKLELICQTGPPSSNLQFTVYIYYLSKYYEYLDTFLQFLRSSVPPHTHLHIFHHSLVAPMVYLWLQYNVSLQYIGLIANCGVHVLMYYYYFYRSYYQITPKWKYLITYVQLIQFSISFVCFVATSYYVYKGYNCGGTNVTQ